MRRMRGSFTVEAAVIIPLILFIFGVLLHILFYWHDKNILMSTAHEMVALGSSRSEMSEMELEYAFYSRMKGRMLIFDNVECDPKIEEDLVTIAWSGSKKMMLTKGEYSMKRTKPETYIRKNRKLEKLGDKVVEKN